MRALRTIPHHTFQSEPDSKGGATLAAAISKDRIIPAPKRQGKKKAPPIASYLLIGFDTEYQSIAAVDVTEVRRGEADAKNVVLSYQYNVKLVEKAGDAGRDLSVSGIIVPKDGERLAFEDFIAFAVGVWLGEFPDQQAPANIYLVGHFTRADLPAFSAFTEIVQQHLTSIRNTLVSMGSPITIMVGDNVQDDDIELKVELRDTILLAPGNAKSLSNIGEIMGVPKVSLHEDLYEEVRIKGNMAELRDSNWQLFRDYAIRDAEICVRYAERVMRQNTSLLGDFSLPITLTSFGTSLVIKGWEDQGRDANALLGREIVQKDRYNKRLGRRIKVKTTVDIEKVHWNVPFVTESYHGGRNEQFMFGAAPVGDWRDLDLSSAYTTAMSLIHAPRWNELRHVNDLSEIRMLDLAFACIDFEFPESVRFPTLPVRTENGILFPRKGRAYCGAPEIWLARELGAELSLLQAITVPTDTTQPIFSAFIRGCIHQRSQHEKGSFHNLFWKEVGNSTYGKTAQGLREKRVYDVRSDEMEKLPPSRLTQPFFASFITSYTRAVLGEIINSFPTDVHVFSVTTDGFLATPSDTHLAAAMMRPLASSFRGARFDLMGDDNALEVKHSVRQPIGWRTRGSATLIPGDNGKEGIVLQKGGIKTNKLLGRKEENDYIVNLFLDRTPNQDLRYTTGIGLKDMIDGDTDFVQQDNIRRLSMEFDWKRAPVDEREVAFEFAGKRHSHLSFNTRPIENAEEFKTLRQAWDRYKIAAGCLKSMTDLLDFERYLQIQELPASTRRYASRIDGDINRLRRDLCRAFKHQKAGFADVVVRERFSHQQFSAALEACGIPCIPTDVENGKRYLFSPHTSIDTPRAREAFHKLRDEYFPEIEESAFFEEISETPCAANDNAPAEGAA